MKANARQRVPGIFILRGRILQTTRQKPLYLAKSETYLMGGTWNIIVRGELGNSYITTLLQLILKRTLSAGFITSSFLVAFGSLVDGGMLQKLSESQFSVFSVFCLLRHKKTSEHLLFCSCLTCPLNRCHLYSLALAKYGWEEEK